MGSSRIAVHINTAAVDVHRSKPSAMVNDDDARHHTVSNVGAREQRTAFIAYQHDIARLNAACLSIRRIDPARFAVFNIGKMMTGRTVKLAVHAVAALTKTSRKAPSFMTGI